MSEVLPLLVLELVYQTKKTVKIFDLSTRCTENLSTI